MVTVVEALRKSIAERSHLRNALTALAGVQFDTTDYLAYFMNEYGEQIVFRQVLGDPLASLLHSDFDWEPIVFDPEVVTGAQRAARMGVRKVSDLVHVPGFEGLAEFLPLAGDLEVGAILDTMPIIGGRSIVSKDELRWIHVCADSSAQWREPSR
ncbi:hypothetical protein [Nocardia sp. NPDC060259]|uniref:hypothetical protein n=1 Tax=Nocardia sp. NPDC060259 TaxID=3347088 RepID=UPI003649F3D8